MAVCIIVGVFAVENVAELLVSRYMDVLGEATIWAIIAVICGLIVYEVGEDRGDW